MLIYQNVIRPSTETKYNYLKLFLLLCISFICPSLTAAAEENSQSIYQEAESKSFKKQTQTYYLYIADFIQSFIEIPTSNVSGDSSTISSTYLAGRAPLYNVDNQKIGTCSASFLCMQNENGIYTDISNYITVDNGLIVTWFTPTTLINLELDSIVHSMVTECIVTATTKVGFNPFYGQTFDLVVSSEDQRIYFVFTRTGTIF
jgi:hypothetical protein